MRKNCKKIRRLTVQTFLSLVFAGLLFGTCSGQANGWTEYKTRSGQLRFELPVEPVIVNDYGDVNFYAFSGSTTLRITVAKISDGADRMVKDMSIRDVTPYTVSQFQLGKFQIKQYIFKTDDSFATDVYVGRAGNYYLLSADGPNGGDANLRRFLASIKLDDQLLFKNLAAAPDNISASKLIDDLRSSQEATDALKVNCKEKIKVFYTLAASDIGALRASEGITQPVIYVRLPDWDSYEMSQQFNDLLNGTKPKQKPAVHVRIMFKSDGCVGSITTTPDVDRDRMKRAADLYLGFRFIPAKKGKEKVDSEEEHIWH